MVFLRFVRAAGSPDHEAALDCATEGGDVNRAFPTY
jgi:hypothetical protein